jgi:uncharacterized protein (DUF1330 family)
LTWYTRGPRFCRPSRGAVVTTSKAESDAAGAYYVLFDVEVRDVPRYRAYMDRVRPALERAGGRYLVRGGEHKVYEGDWTPSRLVVLEFPSQEAWESFYYGPAYAEIKTAREAVSSGRMVGVQGMAPGA